MMESLEPRRLLAALPLGIGGNGFDGGSVVAVGADGSTVVAGLFSGTADFQPGRGRFLLTAVGDTDAFVAKYSADGQLVWANRFGGDYSRSELRKPGDREFAFNPTRIDTFVGRVGGQPINAGEYVNDVKVGPKGDVFLTGSFIRTADFGFGPGQSGGQFVHTSADPSYADAYVLRLDGATGATRYASVFTGRFDVTGLGLAIDHVGNATVTGYFTRDVDFNPHPRSAFVLSADGRDDAFVARLSVSGKLAYVRQYGSDTTDINEREAGNGVALSPDEALAYVGGTFHSGADFDPGPAQFRLSPGGGGRTDGFVMAVDNSTGDLVWVQPTIAGGQFSGVSQVAVGPDGSVYSAGYFQQTVDVDPGPNKIEFKTNQSGSSSDSRDTTDLLVERQAGGRSGGAVQWVDQLAGTGYETIGSLAVDSAGSVYLAGGYYGTLDLAPGPAVRNVTSIEGARRFKDPNTRGTDRSNSFDGFLSYLSPSGKYLNGLTVGGPSDDILTGVALGPNNTFAVAGRYGSSSFKPYGGSITEGAGPFAAGIGLESSSSEAALLLAGLERPLFGS